MRTYIHKLARNVKKLQTRPLSTRSNLGVFGSPIQLALCLCLGRRRALGSSQRIHRTLASEHLLGAWKSAVSHLHTHTACTHTRTESHTRTCNESGSHLGQWITSNNSWRQQWGHCTQRSRRTPCVNSAITSTCVIQFDCITLWINPGWSVDGRVSDIKAIQVFYAGTFTRREVSVSQKAPRGEPTSTQPYSLWSELSATTGPGSP